MTDYWDKNGPSDTDPKAELKAYIEQRKKKARQYMRTAKQAQDHIERLQRLDAAHRRALGKSQ